jgi:outer membrane protein
MAIIIPAFILSGFQVSASTNLSLSNCLRMAENANPEILKARKKIEESKMKIVQNAALFLPSVNVSAFLTSLDQVPPSINFKSVMLNGPAPDIAGNPLLQYAYQDNFSGSIKATMPLFTGGRTLAMLKTAVHELALNKALLKTADSQLRLDVTRSYYGIILNTEMRRLTEDTIAQLQRRVTLVSNLVAAGTATDYDLLKTKVQLSSWSARWVEIMKNLNSSGNHLSYLLGSPVEKKIIPNGSLEEPRITSLTQAFALDETLALSQRPEVKISDRLMRMGKENVHIKLSTMLPQASFQFEQNYMNKKKDPSLESGDWRNWWDIRVGLSWDIFSFGRRAADLNQARLELKEKQIDLSAARERVRMDVEDSWYDLEQSRQSLEAAKKNHQLSELALELARSKKSSGTITEVDEFDSRLGEIDARVQVLKSVFDLIMASAQYDRALGR